MGGVEGDGAAELPAVLAGRPADLVLPRPLATLEGHDDLQPLDAFLGPISREPAQLVRDVVEIRGGEARSAIVPRVAVEAAQHRVAHVQVLDRPARPLERLLVPVADPVRLAVLGLQRIGRPQDGDLAGSLSDEPRPSVADEEAVRLPAVRLDGGCHEADETAPFGEDGVHGPDPPQWAEDTPGGV